MFGPFYFSPYDHQYYLITDTNCWSHDVTSWFYCLTSAAINNTQQQQQCTLLFLYVAPMRFNCYSQPSSGSISCSQWHITFSWLLQHWHCVHFKERSLSLFGIMLHRLMLVWTPTLFSHAMSLTKMSLLLFCHFVTLHNPSDIRDANFSNCGILNVALPCSASGFTRDEFHHLSPCRTSDRSRFLQPVYIT